MLALPSVSLFLFCLRYDLTKNLKNTLMSELGSKLSPHPVLLKDPHAAALLVGKLRIPSVLGGS